MAEAAMQTIPPPDQTFTANAGFAEIYDAYEKDYVKVLSGEETETPPMFQKPNPAGSDQQSNPKVTATLSSQTSLGLPSSQPVQPSVDTGGEEESDLGPVLPAIMTLERMVNQNIFDDVTQDYKYWEDISDEHRNLEGSLLPLWKFTCDGARLFVVSDICWSPFYHDLFIAAYMSEKPGIVISDKDYKILYIAVVRIISSAYQNHILSISAATSLVVYVDFYGHEPTEGEGMICLFTLKNPGIPERVFQSPCGVTSVQFHPTRASIIAAGREDGAVIVYDIRSPVSTRTVCSSAVDGKHLLPVSQVQWVSTDPGENLCFYSVSQDGRISQWLVWSSSLQHEDIFDFNDSELNAKLSQGSAKSVLEGSATCIAISPRDKCELLIGVDTGAIFQVRTTCHHSITRYPAHVGAVRNITWNRHHIRVFATCSIDWTLKIWLYNCFRLNRTVINSNSKITITRNSNHSQISSSSAPVVTLDLGSPVTCLSWSPYSSSVLAGVSDEGRVFIYDLFLRKCLPLCSQNVTHKRRLSLSCVAFNPFSPVILVGGEKGYLVTHKLSPNLRKPLEEAKITDEEAAEIEVCKMERILALNQEKK
ncbi:dynein intermediate chain 2, ciliary-like [Penaeus monodon]|uniref:dynein intermediate chain 2, ciliary-like n=1 Tax=Penaeus monodon TaxID=6687 RepID=UPI0018A7963E|nr:dynein intermediate chain 2, ciliary-like [Penaeus monodon]